MLNCSTIEADNVEKCLQYFKTLTNKWTEQFSKIVRNR